MVVSIVTAHSHQCTLYYSEVQEIFGRRLPSPHCQSRTGRWGYVGWRSWLWAGGSQVQRAGHGPGGCSWERNPLHTSRSCSWHMTPASSRLLFPDSELGLDCSVLLHSVEVLLLAFCDKNPKKKDKEGYVSLKNFIFYITSKAQIVNKSPEPEQILLLQNSLTLCLSLIMISTAEVGGFGPWLIPFINTEFHFKKGEVPLQAEVSSALANPN